MEEKKYSPQMYLRIRQTSLSDQNWDQILELL